MFFPAFVVMTTEEHWGKALSWKIPDFCPRFSSDWLGDIEPSPYSFVPLCPHGFEVIPAYLQEVTSLHVNDVLEM